MSNDLWKLTAVEAVVLLKKREISPLDLVEASARRIAEVEPAVNALPTLCLDRARAHARRIMVGQACEAEGEAGWLAGLPVSIKDLTDVAGVRTTYGSPLQRRSTKGWWVSIACCPSTPGREPCRHLDGFLRYNLMYVLEVDHAGFEMGQQPSHPDSCSCG
jgi:hypothetical protein